MSRLLAALVLLMAGYAHPAGLRRVYVDQVSNVHLVTADNKDVRISSGRNATRVELSPDRRTVAWLAKAYIPGRYGLQPAPFSLKIYRNGRTREIECGQIIRDYWFWMNGRQLGMECGGWHGAGREILYDLSTLDIVEEFEEHESPAQGRPAWSNSGNEPD